MGVKRLKIEVSRVSLLIFCSDWMVSLSKAENNTGGKMCFLFILTLLSDTNTIKLRVFCPNTSQNNSSDKEKNNQSKKTFYLELLFHSWFLISWAKMEN